MTRWIQANEPSPVVPGDEWIHSVTGVWKVRWGTAWTTIGNIGLANVGLASLQGANMAGAITGDHGLASLDSPNFSETAMVDGLELAPKNWVTNSITVMHDELYALIPKQVAGAGADIASRIAFGSSVTDPGGELQFDHTGGVESTAVIPLPYYGDANHTQASISEVILCIASISSIVNHDGSAANDSTITCTVDKTTLIVHCKNSESAYGGIWGTAKAQYAIVCMRA